jgi:hypothetical protein
MHKIIVTFPSTYAAIKAERLCMQHAITCKVIPVPRDISSDCGIALELDPDQKDLAEKMFQEQAINPTFVVRTPPQ